MHSEDHDTIREKLDAYSTGALDDMDWVTVRTHLAECDTCETELAQCEAQRDRAHPQRVAPAATARLASVEPERRRPHGNPPGWPIVFGAALAASLVSFGIGYALGCGH